MNDTYFYYYHQCHQYYRFKIVELSCEKYFICRVSTLSTTITDSAFKIAPECYIGNNLIILKRNYAEQAIFLLLSVLYLLAIRMVVNKGWGHITDNFNCTFPSAGF